MEMGLPSIPCVILYADVKNEELRKLWLGYDINNLSKHSLVLIHMAANIIVKLFS